MSEQTHLASDGMDAMKVCSDRQSLEEFTPRLRRHMWAILNFQDTLRTLKDVFDSGQRVSPPACEDAIQSLTSISEHSRQFHASIERSMHLPLVVVPLRLPLLVTLKNINIQIMKLAQLLSILRAKGKTVLSQSSEERYVIVQELIILIQYCEQAMQQAEELLRKAQEREYSAV